jgi:signal transduction histidine kinase
MDPAVEEALRRRRDQIIERWFARVSKGSAARYLPREVVLNNVPGLVDAILDGMARARESLPASLVPRDISARHGESRLDMGYGLKELGEEYNSLREALLDTLESAGVPLNNKAASVLHGAVDLAHREGVSYYIELREERLRHSQSEFLARLVHDFRSPLATILTSIGLVRKPGTSAKELGRNLARMERATRRLLFLVEAQLATEGALSGKLQIKETEVQLASVAAEVVELLQARAEGQGVDLRVEIPGDLWLKTDRLLLGQVLQNLVDNALKYTNSGEVLLRASQEQGGVRITVEDTGRGISPEMLPVIFDMYSRSEHSTPGRGVGLAVVKAVVTALGGTVGATSRQGTGSCFTVSLPRQRAVLKEERPSMEPDSHEAARPSM